MFRKSLAIPAVAFLILSGGGGIGRLSGRTSVHAADTYSGTISVTDYQAPNALGAGGLSSAEANQELAAAMVDSALGLDYKGNFYADLATEVPSTANGGLKVVNGDETITYHLKPNQKWSDGSPITTADWMAQWAFENYAPDIAIGPGTPSDQLLSATMKGNDLVLTLKGVLGSALQQLLPGPLPWEYYQKKYGAKVNWDMSSFNRAKDVDPKTDLVPTAIYHSSGMEKVAQAWLQDNYNSPSDLFNGPYKLKSWSADQRFVLEANPYYTALPPDAKHPRPAIIQMVVLSEDGPTYIQDLKAASTYNSIDVAMDFSPQNVPDLKQTKYQVVVQPGLTYELLNLMVGPTYKGQKNPLADVRVRQALNYAINKEQFLSALFPGFDPKLLQLSSPYPGASPWSINSKLPQNVYNPAKARQLLASAGYATSLGSGATHLNLDYATTTRTDRIKAGQILQRFWNQVGISVKIKYYNAVGQNGLFSAWGDGGVLNHHAYQIAEHGFLENPDPDEGSLNWLPQQINSATCPNCANTGEINDPKLTKLLLQGRQTLDNAKRMSIYAQVQQYFYSQMYNISLYTVPSIDLVKGTVGNFKQSITQSGPLWNAFEWFYDPSNSQKAILR